MCTIATNKTAEEQLQKLERSDDRLKIEKKLIEFAKEASVNVAGALDNVPPLRDYPADLRHVRRKRFGRHRVFYTGHHSRCSYHVIFIKMFKKENEMEEHSRALQKMLRRSLLDETVIEIKQLDAGEQLQE